MGRPALTKETKRGKVLQVKVTDGEYQQVLQECERLSGPNYKMTASAYGRFALLKLLTKKQRRTK